MDYRKAYNRIRFGKVTKKVKDTLDGGLVLEIEYRDRNGNVCGYWAHGAFDPHLPYTEEPFHTSKARRA